jgi:Holliday junction DNA helicase RuvA
MIDSVTGILAAKSPTSAVVRTGGFNFRIPDFRLLLRDAPAAQKEITLLTYSPRPRGRGSSLYADSPTAWSRISSENPDPAVSGIGPRLAVGILSGATASRVREAIEVGDADFLVTLPGVGKKLAQRLVVELREKFAPGSSTLPTPGTGVPGALQSGMSGDAAAALVSLGFTRNAAVAAVQEALQELGSDVSVETLVRKALSQGTR